MPNEELKEYEAQVEKMGNVELTQEKETTQEQFKIFRTKLGILRNEANKRMKKLLKENDL